MKRMIVMACCVLAFGTPALALEANSDDAPSASAQASDSYGWTGPGTVFSSGDIGFMATMEFLRRHLARSPDFHWMSKIRLDGVTSIKFTYMRRYDNLDSMGNVPQFLPDRPLSDYATGKHAEPGDRWSAEACAVYTGQGLTNGSEHSYHFHWGFERVCHGQACHWRLRTVKMYRVPQCRQNHEPAD